MLNKICGIFLTEFVLCNFMKFIEHNVFYLIDFQHEDISSNEVVEIIPEPQVVKRRGRPVKAKSTNTGNEIEDQTSLILKSQKTSWVWNYFIKKHSDELGGIRAYCQFVN